MTISRIDRLDSMMRKLVLCAIVAAPGIACATPPAAAQFQQGVQQQQTRSQLQKSQQQQQLRQNVADTARHPSANDARSQQQQNLADNAQRERERANQQALLQRDQDSAELPRVVPQKLPAPKPHDGG